MRILSIALTCLIATVWFVNGLVCKVLNLVPRHQEIVARILGETHAPIFTRLIGIGEILLAFWIISRIYPRICAIVQITLVMAMNIIENLRVREELLWGPWNFLFALLFCAFLWWKEFIFEPRIAAR